MPADKEGSIQDTDHSFTIVTIPHASGRKMANEVQKSLKLISLSSQIISLVYFLKGPETIKNKNIILLYDILDDVATIKQQKVKETHVYRKWLTQMYSIYHIVYPDENVSFYTGTKLYALEISHLMLPGTLVIDTNWALQNSSLQLTNLTNNWKRNVILKPSLGNTNRANIKTNSKKKTLSFIDHHICQGNIVIVQPVIPRFMEWSFPVIRNIIPPEVSDVYGAHIFNAANVLKTKVVSACGPKIQLPSIWRLDLTAVNDKFYVNEIETMGAGFLHGKDIDFTYIVGKEIAERANTTNNKKEKKKFAGKC